MNAVLGLKELIPTGKRKYHEEVQHLSFKTFLVSSILIKVTFQLISKYVAACTFAPFFSTFIRRTFLGFTTVLIPA